ncbi:MAG: Holliday junction resolvase [Chloroflexi bacterium RBG_13_51_18]|nr:MAG: Holliday junction resolvase [Chloroflexi bacterium RBG_13_51_18]
METAAVIAVSAVVAIFIIIVAGYIIRLTYERRFKDWCDAENLKWQADMEQARKSAVQQSRAVLGGKFTEQMVPFFPDFKYDPTEVRFIGSPIDLIVFPGLAQGDPQEIVILEVKTGKSAGLTPAQKKIRQLIEDGMVRWEEIHQKAEGET